MRVVVVGSGAREHAIAWRLGRCASVERVYSCPGSAGMEDVAERWTLDPEDADALTEKARSVAADLVVIGPEGPLVAGLADRLRRNGLTVLGPSAQAARIEGSKAWAMELCHQYGIPAPRALRVPDGKEAVRIAAGCDLPVVLKADGLASGKGVVVARTRAEAVAAAETLGRRGPVVFEECLEGPEVSAFALSDGAHVQFYGLARDHKRLLDGDQGPMTGGMGAFTPVADVSPELVRAIRQDILEAAVAAMADRGCPFTGFLFAGLMLTASGPQVLEFNCRLGDPEAQVLLPQIDGDLALQWRAAAQGEWEAGDVSYRPGAAVGVVLASAGYPAAPHTGEPIEGLDEAGQVMHASDVLAFHAATDRRHAHWYTTGGRVLTLVGRAATADAARQAAYRAADTVRFPGAQRRNDIAGSTRWEGRMDA